MLRDFPALTDPELYAAGREHEAWDALRRDEPVSWQDAPDFDGYWAVTAHAPAHEVLSDWGRYSSAGGTILRPDMSAPYPGAGKMPALVDPPRHDELRRAIWPLFTPRAAACLERRAREVVRERLDAVVGTGPCEFVADVAGRLVLPLAGALLGIPEADLGRVGTLLRATVATITDVDAEESRMAHLELMLYYAELVAACDAGDGADLVSALKGARDRGLPITDEEIVLACDNVVVGAAETTKQAAAGGVVALAERPAAWEALAAGEVDLARAVEEVLRWTSPALHVLRTAREDVTLAGQSVRAGEPVAVWLAAANRDPAAFPDAGAFEPGREPNRHLAFGIGVHFCVGAALTRLVLRVLLEELLGAARRVSVTGSPTRLRSFVTRGFSSLPLELQSR